MPVRIPRSVYEAAGRPFVRLFAASTELVLRLIGVQGTTASEVTEEEIHALLAEGSQSGAIEPQEHEIVENVLKLDDRPTSSMMVPRSDVVWLDASRPFQESLDRVISTEHSRYPVCRGDLREILGVVHAKKVLAVALTGCHVADHVPETTGVAAGVLESLVEPPLFVPEGMGGLALLDRLRDRKTRIAFVVDEYGELLGLVTLRDILGTLAAPDDLPETGNGWAIRRADGTWLLDGGMPITEMKELLDLSQVPEDERAGFSTLAGMLLHLFGNVPAESDTTDWGGWRFEIVDMDGPRIDKVLASTPVSTGARAVKAG